jgi:hypothetical protein
MRARSDHSLTEVLASGSRARNPVCMEAVRCLQCGETRWSFLSGTLERLLGQPCESCGGRVVRERRRPGTAHTVVLRERRERGPRPGKAPRVPASRV